MTLELIENLISGANVSHDIDILILNALLHLIV